MKRTELKRSESPQRKTGRANQVKMCPHCGDEFLAFGEYVGLIRKFCSPACNGAARSARTIASYPPEAEVRRLYEVEGMSDVKLGKHFGKSYQWAFKLRKHYGIAPNPSSAYHVPLSRRRDRARWGIHLKPENCCRLCGVTGASLHLHHVIPRSMCTASKFDLRNGLPLCGTCHHKWHQRSVVIYRDVFAPDEWAYISTVELTGQRIEAWLDDRYPARPADGSEVVAAALVHARERAQRCIELRHAGMSDRDIAEHEGTTKHVVANTFVWARRNGMDVPAARAGRRPKAVQTC